MPDWLTHSLVGWIVGRTIKLDVALVAIGSLIPDISKFTLLFRWLFNIDLDYFFMPIHTPICALLICCIIALCFSEVKKAVLCLFVGVITHFILDLFLVNVSGGILLLFPFSWNEWQYGLIRSDDYMMTILAVVAAVIVYYVYFLSEKRKSKQIKKM